MKKIIIGILLITALIVFDDQLFDIADVDCMSHPEVVICQFSSSDYAAELQAYVRTK